MRVFAREGYAGASVNAIAEQAGYTIGALYSNFATKDELFWAAFEQHCSSELAALDALIASNQDLGELIGAITNRFADLDETHREWWALWAELWLYGQRHPSAAGRLAAVQADSRAAIARALDRAGHPGSDEVAAVIHALWTGFMLYRLTAPDALKTSSPRSGPEPAAAATPTATPSKPLASTPTISTGSCSPPCRSCPPAHTSSERHDPAHADHSPDSERRTY